MWQRVKYLVLWVVQDAGQLPAPSGLLDQLAAISETFSGKTLEDIYAALRARGDEWSRDTLAALSKWAACCAVCTYDCSCGTAAYAWHVSCSDLGKIAICFTIFLILPAYLGCLKHCVRVSIW